ncbi:MAG: hypothetical protein UY99_C0017G0024 [Parcubacteria group bacterium GW2011_GWA1_59_11]|nr:MAG: hypothetical protein UY99_C0017G0024 [Parcubacteria group bacterium GW2011_GWA1_59_11]
MRKGPLLGGAASALGLLALFFSLITLISDWGFARTQFSEFWYFILPLSAGFGVQVGLYLRIRDAVRSAASKSVLAVSGTASGGAMLSCGLVRGPVPNRAFLVRLDTELSRRSLSLAEVEFVPKTSCLNVSRS